MTNVFDKPCTFDEAWDSRDYLLEECWNCGGEGFVANCQQEFACVDPESGCELCMQPCEFCADAKADRNPKGGDAKQGSVEDESGGPEGICPGDTA